MKTPEDATAALRACGSRKIVAATDSGCWSITGAVYSNSGYSRVKVRGKEYVGHRWIYERLIGAIPPGRVLDHLCRNRWCVNPYDMDPVTGQINVLRGLTIVAINAAKTVCHKGHPLVGANLFVRADGRRRCRTCEKATQNRLRSTEEYKAAHAAYERARRARKGAISNG